MKRREFITLLSGATAWPFAARAQQPTVPVVGFLNGASAEGYALYAAAFRQGLKGTGYVEGQNVSIEYRWADGHYDRLPALAADLVHRDVAVIAATSTPAALAAKAGTVTIPIVFTTGGDPVKLGLVSSLNRPGGNVTGVTSLITGLGSKRLGMLRELAPGITTVATLTNPSFQDAESQLKDVEAATRSLGLRLIVEKASTEQEIDAAFVALGREGADALMIAVDPFFLAYRDRMVALAARPRIPAVYPVRDFAAAGGLMSYGTDFADSYRQAGIYAGRVLRGENPADLPVQQSVKFEFLINL